MVSVLPQDIYKISPLERSLSKIICQYIFPTVWTSLQAHVIKRIREGKNVFFTGSAGTGKTALLKHIIEKEVPLRGTYVTASTGRAAVMINGRTLHSFSGIGLGKESVDVLKNRISRNATYRNRWKECIVLIIEEISMIDAGLFDKIEEIARYMKASGKPFGGIQLIVTGDFLQLPPVGKIGNKPKFAFTSESWRKCFKSVIMLKKIFRQSDREFVKILQEIRIGHVSDKGLHMLKNRVRAKLDCKNGVLPTKLYPYRRTVEEENLRKLKLLGGKDVVYFGRSEGNQSALKIIKKSCPVGYELKLKLRAQVMLVKNLDLAKGLCNGSRGVVIGFSNGFPKVQFENKLKFVIKPEKWEIKERGKTIAAFSQIPLMLAWALTIHKCQGMTVDKAIMDLSSAFECGQAYVSLSRVRSLNGLCLEEFSKESIFANKTAIKFYEQFKR